MLPIFRTSEFWVGLVAAILQFLVAQQVIPQAAADFVNMAVVYIFARIFGKVARAVLPPAAQ